MEQLRCKRLHLELLANRLNEFERELRVVIDQHFGRCSKHQSQFLEKIDATVYALDFDVVVSFLSFEYLTAITEMNWLPVCVFGTSPRISIMTSCNDILDEKCAT